MESNIVNILVGLYQACDRETLVISDSAIGLSSDKINPSIGRKPIRAFITTEDAQIRYSYDGSDPDSDNGHLIAPRSVITIMGYETLSKVRFIREGSTDGILQVTYER